MFIFYFKIFSMLGLKITKGGLSNSHTLRGDTSQETMDKFKTKRCHLLQCINLMK